MNPFRYDATIYYKTMPERVTKEEFERKQSEMERKSQMILDTYNNAPDNAREMFIELYRDKATDRRFVDDYIDLIRENGHNRFQLSGYGSPVEQVAPEKLLLQ